MSAATWSGVNQFLTTRYAAAISSTIFCKSSMNLGNGMSSKVFSKPLRFTPPSWVIWSRSNLRVCSLRLAVGRGIPGTWSFGFSRNCTPRFEYAELPCPSNRLRAAGWSSIFSDHHSRCAARFRTSLTWLIVMVMIFWMHDFARSSATWSLDCAAERVSWFRDFSSIFNRRWVW